ncbi:MAG: EVE domain-containing protein [Actinomycetota bacterium]|nr:EVE domain-containing protein [Actinomycetota bacterium]
MGNEKEERTRLAGRSIRTLRAMAKKQGSEPKDLNHATKKQLVDALLEDEFEDVPQKAEDDLWWTEEALIRKSFAEVKTLAKECGWTVADFKGKTKVDLIAEMVGWQDTEDEGEGAAPSLWVYKNNARGETLGNTSFGDWSDFFERGATQRWGGSWMTTSNLSLKILREEMREGDRVLAWQTDKGQAMGIALVVRIDQVGAGQELYLRRDQAFSSPVPLLKLRREDQTLGAVAAFRPGGGTLFRVTPEEAEVLLRVCERWQA